jgi:hypothetical protein
MASSGMLRRVALVRTDVSEEISASIIRVTRIGELGTLVVTSNRRTSSVRRLLVTANVIPSSPILVTLMMEALRSSEATVLTRATRRNIPEDAILHSHRREHLKSYKENIRNISIRNYSSLEKYATCEISFSTWVLPRLPTRSFMSRTCRQLSDITPSDIPALSLITNFLYVKL